MAGRLRRITGPGDLPRRRKDAHKGDFGRVLVVGGSRGMIGAPALAANAALRGGAGLVAFAAPETVQLTVAGLCPCATSVPLACDGQGGLAGESVRQMLRATEGCDALAVGPGLGVGPGQQALVRAAIEQDRPLVIDADGLNNLARIDSWPVIRRCVLVLTPHPGEFSRLTDSPVKDIQAARENTAVQAVRAWEGSMVANTSAMEPGNPKSAHAGGRMAGIRNELVLVLKGAGTVVTDGRRMFVNATGNPGMATGGSGDVLTGLVAAFIGQGLAPFEAACLAVHVHGLAGDLAAKELGEASLIASDLLEYLPAAISKYPGR